MSKKKAKTGVKTHGSGIDELYRPAFIHQTQFMILNEQILTLIPTQRNVMLSMNVYDMKEINPLHPDQQEDPEAPTHVLILCIKLLTHNVFQPIGGLLIYKEYDQSLLLAESLKAFIHDLWIMGVHVVASVSPPFKLFKDILRHLVAIEDFDLYSDAISYVASPFKQIIHIYDFQFLLIRLQNLFRDGHLHFTIGDITEERVHEASWDDMSTVFKLYREFDVVPSFLEDYDDESRRVHIFTEQVYNTFVEALFIEVLSSTAESCEVFLSCLRSFLRFTETDSVELNRIHFEGSWDDLIDVLNSLTFRKSRKWTCSKENPSQEEYDLNSSTRREICFSHEEEQASTSVKEQEFTERVIKRSRGKKGKKKRNVDIKRDPKIMCKITVIDNAKCLAKLEEKCSLQETNKSSKKGKKSKLKKQSEDELPGIGDILYDPDPKDTHKILENTKNQANKEQSATSSGKKNSKSPRTVILQDTDIYDKDQPSTSRGKKTNPFDISYEDCQAGPSGIGKTQESGLVVSETCQISYDPDPKEICQISERQKQKGYAKKQSPGKKTKSPRAAILKDTEPVVSKELVESHHDISCDPDPNEIFKIPEAKKKQKAKKDQPSTSSGKKTNPFDTSYEDCQAGPSGIDKTQERELPERQKQKGHAKKQSPGKKTKSPRAAVFTDTELVAYKELVESHHDISYYSDPNELFKIPEAKKKEHAEKDQPSTSLRKITNPFHISYEDCQAGPSGIGKTQETELVVSETCDISYDPDPKEFFKIPEAKKKEHAEKDQPCTLSRKTTNPFNIFYEDCQAGPSGIGRKMDPKESFQIPDEEKTIPNYVKLEEVFALLREKARTFNNSYEESRDGDNCTPRERQKRENYERLDQLFTLLAEKASTHSNEEGNETASSGVHQISKRERKKCYTKLKELCSLFEDETGIPKAMVLVDTDVVLMNKLLNSDDEEDHYDSDDSIEFIDSDNVSDERTTRKSYLPVKKQLTTIVEDDLSDDDEFETSMNESSREVPNILEMLDKEFEKLKTTEMAFEKDCVTSDMLSSILGIKRVLALARDRRMSLVRPDAFIVEHVDYFAKMIKERNRIQSVRYYGRRYDYLNIRVAFDATLNNDKTLYLVTKD